MTHLTLANGNVRLAASVDGPMDAVPILLLHGASVSRDPWDETRQQLMDRYCVWTLDFRGHGHSDRAPNYNLAGGVAQDHISARHLLSHASAIQRVDPRCLSNDSLKETLSSISTKRPFLCPAKLVRGEERFGAAFWDEHAGSLLAINPHLEIVQYKQCGHHPHRMPGFEQRFFYDLEDFIAKT